MKAAKRSKGKRITPKPKPKPYKMKPIQGKCVTSGKLSLNIKDLEKDFYRADLEFYDVEKGVPSYEGRVFLNNPTADINTPTDVDHGYVGSYIVFGHGSCLGDAGHCNVHAQREKYDLIPNALRPYTVSLTITDQLKKLAKKYKEFTITVCPNVVKPPTINHEEVDMENVVKYSKVSILTYDKES